MQILPQTARVPGPPLGRDHVHTSPTSATPEVNIAYGSYYLRYLLDEYHGSTVAGAGRLQRRRGQRRPLGRRGATRDGARVRRSRDIPFPETRAYVAAGAPGPAATTGTTYATQLGYR